MNIQQPSPYIYPLLVTDEAKNSLFDETVSSVCSALGITRNRLMEKNRSDDLVIARYLVMYLLRKHTGSGYKKIGAYFNKNHATVIHGVRQIETAIKINDKTVLNLLQKCAPPAVQTHGSASPPSPLAPASPSQIHI
jgi:chromosomal replication initiation ATPase DnaA